MAKVYTCPIEVRGYEQDSYAHVNHAVYVNYLEHARWVMLRTKGITITEFKKWNRWPVIADIAVQYRKPCFVGEQLVIHSQITDSSRAQFRISQKIFRGEQLVLEAQVRVVMVNEAGRPAELPPELAQLWNAETGETP